MKPNLLLLPSALCLLAFAGCQHLNSARSAEPSEAYLDFAKKACEVVESDLPEIMRVAEIVAERHLNGGMIGFPWNYQGLQQELMGRSGGMVCVGFERPWNTNRAEAEKTNDVAIIGW